MVSPFLQRNAKKCGLIRWINLEKYAKKSKKLEKCGEGAILDNSLGQWRKTKSRQRNPKKYREMWKKSEEGFVQMCNYDVKTNYIIK